MNIFDLSPPNDAQARAHGAELYARRDTAAVVPFREVELEGWTPTLQHCHDNVAWWVEKHPAHTAVHGWLYLDLGGQQPCVRFVSHSVIRDDAGELFDITPMDPTFANYPFIASNLEFDQYADIHNSLYAQLDAGFLHHYK